jgi:hypothetical protein
MCNQPRVFILLYTTITGCHSQRKKYQIPIINSIFGDIAVVKVMKKNQSSRRFCAGKAI